MPPLPLALPQIIDYHNSVQPPPEDPGAAPASESALRNVLERFDRLRRPVLHMLGERGAGTPLGLQGGCLTV